MGKLTPFGVELRKLRVEKDLRLLDLAERLGISAAMVSAIETGRKPIPDGFVNKVSSTVGLTTSEIRTLRSAKEQTRKEVRVENLKPEQREMVAAFARNIENLSPDVLAKLRKEIFKSGANEIPFQRKRLGIRVAPLGKTALETKSSAFRNLLCAPDDKAVDIIGILESLHLAFKKFSLEIVPPEEMPFDEGQMLNQEETIKLREDVYLSACRGEGRSRFTACHELGHYLLGHQAVLSRTRLPSEQVYYDAEWQADYFAGTFMMPRDMVAGRNDVALLAKEFGMSKTATEVMLSKYR